MFKGITDPNVQTALALLEARINYISNERRTLSSRLAVLEDDDDPRPVRPENGSSYWPPDYVFIGTEEVAVAGTPSSETPWLWVSVDPPSAEWKSTPRPDPMPDGTQVYHMTRRELHIPRFG